MVADPVVQRIFDAWRELGRPGVFEINDDFEHFPLSLPEYAFYALPRIRRLIADLAGSAAHADEAVELAALLAHWAQRRRARVWGLPELRLVASAHLAEAFESCGLPPPARAGGLVLRRRLYAADGSGRAAARPASAAAGRSHP